MKTTTYLSTIMALGLYACAGTDLGSQSQCTSNADCKGGRICDTVKGICSDPNTNTGSNTSVDAVVRQYDSGSRSADVYQAKDVSQKVMKGDVNCDGVVDGQDITVLKKYLTGDETVFAKCSVGKVNADTDCDNDITGNDITQIQKYLKGTLSTLDCP